MLLYKTNEWKGYGKQEHIWNEYRLDVDKVTMVKCRRQKFFDGRENDWEQSERKMKSWARDDANLPEWLQELLKKENNRTR